ncbi:MAG: PrgI family protein [Lachnospiraceae bacterium]|nr:PrgI family protein [Lachnospiraceae bacterium]
MAAYISVPRDLTRVKSKILFGLTKRQLICFGAAALIGVPTYFGLRSIGNTSLAAMGMILIMLPLFFLAMYEQDGQPLEVIAKHFVDARFRRPKVRPYKTDNYYAVLMRQYQVEKEVYAIVCKEESEARCEDAAEPVEEGGKAGAADRGRRAAG